MTDQEHAHHRSRLSTTTVVFIFLGAALLIPIAGYGILAIAFFSRSPDVAVDHLAEINEGIRTIPESDRAAYAVIDLDNRLDAVRARIATSWGHPSASSISPDSPDWWLTRWPRDLLPDSQVDRDRERELLTDAAPMLAELREVASRPRIGWEWVTSEPDTPLWEVELPYLGAYRRVAAWLTADARAAAREHDPERAARDLIAAAALARQLVTDDQFAISQMIGFHILNDASRTTLAILHDHPEAFDGARLARLSEALTLPLEHTLEGERRYYLDGVQRIYAPGEHGRITPEGLRLLLDTSNAWGSDPGLPIPYADTLPPDAIMLLAPVFAPAMGTASDSLATFDALENEYHRANAQPSVDAEGWRRLSEFSPLTTSDPLARLLLPYVEGSIQRLQQARTTQGAALLALAAHLYRLDHARFPDSADELVPAYLDAIPIDRFTGDPMIYRLTPEGPLIYVTGPDRDDDGGRPAGPSEEVERFIPVPFPPNADWILFPAR